MVAPIGVIRTPYNRMEEVSIQSCCSRETGEVEVFHEYKEGLKDLEFFSYILILHILHKSRRYSLSVKPFLRATWVVRNQMSEET